MSDGIAGRTSCRWRALIAAAVLGALPAAADVLIENVTLIDGTGAASQAGVSVLVMGERIARISRDPVAAPAAVERIDGTGRYLIPGLFDVHIHIPAVKRIPTLPEASPASPAWPPCTASSTAASRRSTTPATTPATA